ncbi:MAG: PEGA domain-containing protein [Pseudomonadota bacterium]
MRNRDLVSPALPALFLVFLAAFLGLSVLANKASAADAPDAEALIRDGIALRRKGDDQAALKLFNQAYDLSKTARALAQIGLAEQALGRWGLAARHLHQAVELGQTSNDPWIKKNRASIDSALEIVGRHVGQLEVTGNPSGAEVRVDGELAGRLPLSAPLTTTVGEVAIEVRAPGFLPIMRGATIATGTLTREVFNLQALSTRHGTDSSRSDAVPVPLGQGSLAGTAKRLSAAHDEPQDKANDPSQRSDAGSEDAAEPSQPSGGMSTQRILALAAGGAAVVALGVGVYEHFLWQSKVKSFGSMPGCGETFENRGVAGCSQLYKDGQAALLRALVVYGLSAGLAITGTILFLTDREPGAGSQKVACGIDPFAVGVRCGLHF